MRETKGSLLVTADRLEIINIPEEKREKAIIDFYDMKQEAERKKDCFFALASVYTHSYSYGSFYPNFVNLSWPEFHECEGTKGVKQRTFQLMQGFCQCPNMRTLENDLDFLKEKEPRTNTGYYNLGQTDGFVGNIEEWEIWHRKWNTEHPEDIDWSQSLNSWFSRPDLIIKILKRELLKKFSENDTQEKARERVSQIKEADVTNAFHECVMKHKGDELEAYASEIGKEICQCNYYKYENQLSTMESQCAKSKREIYSISNKDCRTQFVSIDFKHGMFEFHNEGGAHLGEFRFDGSFNSTNESSHDLKCINQWQKQIGR